ncbi:MAG: hypothetical protein Q9170_006539 [Blastenia crenularia]
MSTQTPSPIRIHIPPTLQHYAVPLHSFLARNPGYRHLVCSAFIFAPPPAPNPLTPSSTPAPGSRLLIVQRAATELAFPSLWEVPGGSAHEDDPTIIHALAREVFEETSLRLTRVVRQVGGVVEWSEVKGGEEEKWLKLGFEIEVAEVGAFAAGEDGQGLTEWLKGVPVELDPEEHGDFAWVTEGEVSGWLEGGEGRQILKKELAEMMVGAFEVRRGR